MPFDGDARWQIDITAADRTAAAFSSVDRRIKGLEAGVASMGRTMAAGVAQTVAFGRGLQQLAVGYGVIAAGQRALQVAFKAGDLGEQADQLGVTTDQLQAYRLMAAQAGVSAEQLDAALLKLTRAMGTANEGNDEMIARFDKLGIKLLDSDKRLRPVADILPELARGMLQVSSDTERSALMADLFGKSGARLKTMLEEWAKGNDRLVSSAKAQNAIVGKEAIEAWDRLGDQLLVANQRWETLVATLGKPVALAGLHAINVQLSLINSTIYGIQKGWDYIAGGPSLETLQSRARDEQAGIDAIRSRGGDPEMVEAQIGRRQRALDELNRQIAEKGATAGGALVTLPPVTVTAGASNPVGKAAGAAGAKLEERLRDLQTERAALEKALAAFDVRGTETVDEVDRRLDTQIKLDKKIADVLKDVPPNSVLAQQLTQEATVVSQLNTRLDERKRLLTEGEGVTQRYGDGSREAARMVEQLNKMLAAGAIDAGTHERALRATTLAAEDQARAYRAAAGGADAFIAGISQRMADFERANSTFELGKRLVDDVSEAFTNLATGAEVDFGKIALSWANMLVQMELKAAASNIWNAITGKGPTNQGLIGSLLGGGSSGGSWLTGDTGGGSSGGGVFSNILSGIGSIFGFADGGRPPIGRPSIVGENGWEMFVPDRPGTIYNQDQLAGMGGNTTVVVNQTVHIGEFVTSTEYRKGLTAVKKAAEDGAYARVIDDRRRGGAVKKVFG